MKKRHRVKGVLKRILFAGILIMLLPFGMEDCKAISQEDIDREERELEAAKQRAEELENEVNNIAANITSTKDYISYVDGLMADVAVQIYELEQKIADKQVEIDNMQQQLDSTLNEIARVEAEINQTRSDLSDAQNTEAEQYNSMKLRIQYMYENGEENFMDILFSSDSMIDFLNNAEYISEISKYDREKLIEYGETKERISTLLANLEWQEGELQIQQNTYESNLADLNREKEGLDIVKQEQEVLQQSYTAIFNSKNAELDNLEKQKDDTEDKKALALKEVAEQEERVDQAKREYAAWLAEQAKKNQDPDAAVAAKLAEINVTGFTWPIPGYNKITSQFGMRIHPILGYEKLHDGTDISGSDINGKPIVAAYSGTVVLAEYYWGYGNCVKIDHGGSIQTLYAHASAILVSVGQYVNAGDTIALVGSTGNSTGPHLHFSLIVKGEFVNPLDYVVVPKY
ncbi:MAG: murein hydrolase activator EnvC family protein [Lachnospiraceae bacterium]